MKTILLATDFSRNAKPASDFALQLAELLQARLVLLHVYQHPLRLAPLQAVFTPMEEKNKVNARRRLYRLRDRMKQASGGQVTITVMARQGSTQQTIAAVAVEQKADLLVMGTAGANSSSVQYFGSQATEMIVRTPVPLLLIPPAARFVAFKNVVVALDLSQPLEATALDGVLRFADRFNAVLNFLCVSSKGDDLVIQQTARSVRNLLRYRAHTLSVIEGDDLAETIRLFTAENRADLVIMLPKEHNRFLFSILESNTQQIARQSDVPVLALVS
ncbi:universal stress protein [Larkinella sp. VNQ87]|uniref:universal stress protein n=1 Tax=Larkinella sp. VNQ87 TaxID=3400921 RepID=UPI003C0131F5